MINKKIKGTDSKNLDTVLGVNLNALAPAAACQTGMPLGIVRIGPWGTEIAERPSGKRGWTRRRKRRRGVSRGEGGVERMWQHRWQRYYR